MKNQFKFYFLSCLAIAVISFVVLYPSFNLAFQDDDWRGVVLPKTDYADGRLFTPYGIQLWFDGILYDIFNSNFYLYYILSFVLRNLVALGILLFIFNLTKDRLAAVLGALLFVVGFSGLQTTYETASTNVYISLVFWLIFLGAFFKSLDKFSFKYLVISGVSLLLATLASPVRTYPLYGWAIIVGVIRMFKKFNNERLKLFLVSSLSIGGIFLFLYYLGIFGWFSLDATSASKINDLSTFFTKLTSFISNLNFKIFLNFLRGLGNIIFPSILDKTGVISTLFGATLLIALTISAYLVIKRRDEKMQIMFAFLLWPLLFYVSYFIVILAGYTTGRETIILESPRRYLLPPFMGFSIGLAYTIHLARKRKGSILLLILIISLFFIHAVSTYTFLNKLSKQRDGFYMVKIWKQIKQIVPESSLSSKKTNVFYFETDGSPRAIYTVNDGFIGHAIALYKIENKPSKLNPKEISAFGDLLAPPIITFEELVSYTRKNLLDDKEPEIWDRIFALRVEGERVIDIKDDVKKRVKISLDK